MTNKKFYGLGMLVMALVFGMMIVGCNINPDDETRTVTYTGTDLGGNEYTISFEISASRNLTARNAGRNQNRDGVRTGDRYKIRIKTPDGEESESEGAVNDVLGDTLTLESNGEEFKTVVSDLTTVVGNRIISSIVGNIKLGNGQIFTVRTFDEIYLRVGRGSSVGPDGAYYHEHYQSWDSIKLIDIYDGKYEDFIEDVGNEENKNEGLKLKMSGTIDFESEHLQELGYEYLQKLGHLQIDFFYLYGNNQTIALGDSSRGGFIEIAPGEFSIEFTVYKNTHWAEVEIPEDGEVIVTLIEIVQTTKDGESVGRDFGEIPEDIPDQTIMATINGLTIELAD